jgi:predicted Fe-Mo cluster-binding NifX family protein
MKIAVTAQGQSLDDRVDPRFGRCPWFLVVETEAGTFQAVENANAGLGEGAGIRSAQLLTEHDVTAVLTGNCGPNAYRALEAGGIQVVVGVNGTVRQAADQFRAGALSPVSGPNVASHSGTGDR